MGGLSHTITQKDLKDRFGKFGDVEDVELRTRKDDDGEESITSTLSIICKLFSLVKNVKYCKILILKKNIQKYGCSGSVR